MTDGHSNNKKKFLYTSDGRSLLHIALLKGLFSESAQMFAVLKILLKLLYLWYLKQCFAFRAPPLLL